MFTPCPECATMNWATSPLLPGFITCSACRSNFDPTQLGIYRIGQIIRCGVQDTVYEARSLEDGSAVAIKIPVFGRMGPDKELNSFLEQARELPYIAHPSVTPATGIGRAFGRLFAWNDLPAGTSILSDLLANWPSVEAAIELVRDLAEVLHFAHERWSMVHGDLNPRAIIMRAEGGSQERLRPSILAICLTKRELGENAAEMESRVLRVTPYMSPEQRGGVVQRVDVRSDVYSLGAILYHLLSGSPPTMAGAGAADSWDISLAREGGFPLALERVIARAMAEEPRERYHSAAALASDLEGLGKAR
jgi:eukaryotic-like serine/threonine-protein kinase